MRGIVKRVLAIAATGILTLGAVAVTGSPASASVKVMCDSGYDGTQYSFYCDLTVTPASDEVWLGWRLDRQGSDGLDRRGGSNWGKAAPGSVPTVEASSCR